MNIKWCNILQVANNNDENKKTKSLIHLRFDATDIKRFQKKILTAACGCDNLYKLT